MFLQVQTTDQSIPTAAPVYPTSQDLGNTETINAGALETVQVTAKAPLEWAIVSLIVLTGIFITGLYEKCKKQKNHYSKFKKH